MSDNQSIDPYSNNASNNGFYNQEGREQQQNQQQLKEIKDTVGLSLVGNLSKSSSTSSANSLTHHSSTTAQKKSQYDLLNILYNTNKLEQERSGECKLISFLFFDFNNIKIRKK